MSEKQPFQKPWTKPHSEKDELTYTFYREADRESFKRDTEMVQVFNRNDVHESPTTSSKKYKPAEKNRYLPKPK